MRLLTKVASLYYNEDKSQQEIAEALQLSRSKVCRLLAEAKSLGVVQITVKPSINFCNDLEAQFERKYGLKEAIIINDSEQDNRLVLLGEAGADYLKRIVTPTDIIGISWGQTVYNVINQLQPFGVSGTKIVQLVGCLNNGGQNVQAVELTRRFGKLFNSEPMLLHCPAVVTSSQVKSGLLDDDNIQNIFELGKKTTIALLGIGNMAKDSQLFRNNHFSAVWHDKLLALGSVGDVCMRFYNAYGESCCRELDDQIMGITLDNIKKIRTVICLAGGEDKATAILGALRGRIPSVLVTDHRTAEKILELDEQGTSG